MPNKSKYTFSSTINNTDWKSDEYPDAYTIQVSINSDSTLPQVITAFRMFLKACEYDDKTVDNLLGA